MARTPPMGVRGPALVAAGCLGLLTPGCRGTASPPAAAAREPSFSLREGERLFGSFCAPCHGETGRGDGAYLSAGAAAAPPDFAAEGVRERMRTERLTVRLAATEAAGEMHCPPWGNSFSPDEIKALATFLEHLGREAPVAEGTRP